MTGRASPSASTEDVDQAGHKTADEVAQANDELQRAIVLSKAAGVPISGDGVVLLRLTRCAQTPEVRAALAESPLLEPCRRRVQEAGCSMSPPSARGCGGAMLLVPLTQELIEELPQKLCDYHIVAHLADVERIRATLKKYVHWKKRPKLGFETGAASSSEQAGAAAAGTGDDGRPEMAAAQQGEGLTEDMDIDVEVEHVYETDSDIGFPRHPSAPRRLGCAWHGASG